MATDEQLDFFAEHYWRGVMDQADHLVGLISEADPHALRRSRPGSGSCAGSQSFLPVIAWQQAKEGEGRFTWTAALYGTEAMAAEARMPIEEYWQQIIAACYLDEPDLLDRWREVNDQIASHCEALNSLAIDRLHVEGENADLWLTLGERRKWIGGGGRNIPSFEVFTTPDWRGTEGWIRFTEPLYVYGSLITGIELEFRDGRVVVLPGKREREPAQGDDRHRGRRPVGRVLAHRLTPLPDHSVHGQYALRRERRRPFGNTHLALGLGLRHTYDGDPSQVSERSGRSSASTPPRFTPTSSRPATARSRRCCATGPSRLFTRTASSSTPDSSR